MENTKGTVEFIPEKLGGARKFFLCERCLKRRWKLDDYLRIKK